MPLLKCIGVNSYGNSYILETKNECLVLDAGVHFKEVKIALDFNITKIKGVLVTHHHKDHDGYSKEYEKSGIPVYRPFENSKITFRNTKFSVKPIPLKDKDGNWVHSNSDGTECPIYGFYITHPEIGTLVYATDCEVIKYKFSEVNHFLIETNYDMETLEDDGEMKNNHVFNGHHSLQACCKFLENNKSDKLRNVVLCHLSSENGNSSHFKSKVKEIVECKVEIALKGKIIEIQKGSQT